MRALILLLPLLAILLSMAYYAGRVHATRALRRSDQVLRTIEAHCVEHAELGEPFAVIVTDEIRKYRNPKENQ